MRGRLRPGVLLGCLLAGAASAQPGHPLPPGAQPLHRMLEASDAVLIATLGEPAPGRLRLRDPRPLAGELDGSLELKVAPSRRAELVPGHRVLLFLRGARSPYVLVNEKHEPVQVLTNPEDEGRWARAVGAALRAGSDPERLRQLYLGWIEQDSDALRQVGLRGLADPRAGLWPLPPEMVRRAAVLASDPERPAEVRRAAVALAVLGESGTQQLLAALDGRFEATDPEVLEKALRSGQAWGIPETRGVLLAALRSPEKAAREAALRAVRTLEDPALREEIRRVASSDPDAALRRRAEQLVAERSDASR
jgi:hypothetical protein